MRPRCGQEFVLAKSPLPENPSLENLAHQAKRLLAEARAGDEGAVMRVREFHPRAAELGVPALHGAQLVLARSYGFASWPKLKQHLEGVERFAWEPSERGPGTCQRTSGAGHWLRAQGVPAPRAGATRARRP